MVFAPWTFHLKRGVIQGERKHDELNDRNITILCVFNLCLKKFKRISQQNRSSWKFTNFRDCFQELFLELNHQIFNFVKSFRELFYRDNFTERYQIYFRSYKYDYRVDNQISIRFFLKKKYGNFPRKRAYLYFANWGGKGNKIARVISQWLTLRSTWLCVRKSMSLLTRRAGNHCQETPENPCCFTILMQCLRSM